MRLRMLLVAVAAVALWSVTLSQALAQGAGGYARGHSDNPNGPTVSPYLNLLQNNSVNSTITGMPVYQSLVKPLVNQGSAISRQGGALSQLQQQVYSGGGGGSATGHASFFMNYSHYFPTIHGRGR